MIVFCTSDHLLTTRCLPLTLMLYNILSIISFFFVCNDKLNEFYRMHPITTTSAYPITIV